MTIRLLYFCVALCAIGFTPAVAAPTVTAVTPVPQVITAPVTSDITVVFDEPVDMSTISTSTIRVFGRWSGPMTGSFQFESENRMVRFTPAENFFHGEWVTVNVSRAVKNAKGEALASGYTWNFWTRTEPGTIDQTFVRKISIRRSGDDWIQSYGAYAGDLNNDGWSDLTIPNERTNDARIFLNDGTGDYDGFKIVGLTGASSPSANEGADFNMDGEIDLAVGSGGNSIMTVMIGDGTGNFSATGHVAARSVKGVGVIDLDCDGWDDIVTANRFGDNITVFRNDGAGGFPVSGSPIETGGTAEFSCAVADANNDGLQDVFVGAFNSNEIIIMLGNGLGGLTFSSRIGINGRPWMIAVGDVNGDGDVDVVAANSYNSNAGVALGDGAGGFLSATTYPTGGLPLAIDLGDLDGDGDLDMVTSNYEGGDFSVYENVGGGVFDSLRTFPAIRAGSCAILHDRDNDGDLDFTGIDELEDVIFIYDNNDSTSQKPPTPPPVAPPVTLGQNHPNPFNPTTTIEFSLTREMRVKLSVFDVGGQLIRTLTDRVYDAGDFSELWDGTNADGVRVRSGVYFYQIETVASTQTRKMVLLK